MAIGTDDAVDKFGTQDNLDDTTTSAITNGSFSVAADHADWTNDDDAPIASVVLTFQYPSGTLDATAHVKLHMALLNVDGTTDEALPDSSFDRVVGVFGVDAGLGATTDVSIAEDIALPNTKTSQEYSFRIENNTGVTISANWDLLITPKTIGPHA